MSDKKSKPSDEEFERAFARASASLDKEDRGLSKVTEKILNRFEEIHNFILDCTVSEYSFYANVFYRWNRQIEEAEKSGLEARIRDAVFEELEKVGRGTRGSIEIKFVFDSYEKILREYDGDYFKLFR